MLANGGLLIPNRNHPLNAGRIAWWLTLPRTYGGAHFRDIIGQNHATIRTGASWAGVTWPGGEGSLKTTATATAQAITKVSNPLIGSNSLSVAAWFMGTATGSNGTAFITCNDNAGGNGYVLGLDGGTPAKAIFQKQVAFATATATANATFTTYTWYRALGTCDSSGNMLLYINGVAQTLSGIANGAMVQTTSVGLQVTDSAHVGYADDLSLWNRKLSATEAYEDYILSRQGYPGVLLRDSSISWFPVQTATAFGLDEEGLYYTYSRRW